MSLKKLKDIRDYLANEAQKISKEEKAHESLPESEQLSLFAFIANIDAKVAVLNFYDNEQLEKFLLYLNSLKYEIKQNELNDLPVVLEQKERILKSIQMLLSRFLKPEWSFSLNESTALNPVISKWEADLSNPREDKMQSLVDFQRKVAVFKYDEDKPQALDNYEAISAFVDKAYGYTKEQKAKILAFIMDWGGQDLFTLFTAIQASIHGGEMDFMDTKNKYSMFCINNEGKIVCDIARDVEDVSDRDASQKITIFSASGEDKKAFPYLTMQAKLEFEIGDAVAPKVTALNIICYNSKNNYFQKPKAGYGLKM